PQSRPQVEELMLHARLMRPMRDAAEQAIGTATDSLAFNPRGRRHRRDLAALQELLDRFGSTVTQVIGMTRAVYDRYDDGLVDEPTVRAIAEQLRRAAHDVRLELRRAGAERAESPAPPTTSIPALTAP